MCRISAGHELKPSSLATRCWASASFGSLPERWSSFARRRACSRSITIPPSGAGARFPSRRSAIANVCRGAEAMGLRPFPRAGRAPPGALGETLPVIEAYLEALVHRLSPTLGDQLLAAWVVGSSALGDFDAARSDIDVQALRVARVDRDALRAVAAALSEVPCPVRGLEFVLYARD